MSIFNLVVNVIDTQATVAGEISPKGKPGSSNTTGAGAWDVARNMSTFLGSIADGSKSASIQYSDGLTFATQTLTFAGDLANNDTLTIAGVLTTFVTATPSGAQVQRGVSQASTMAGLVTYINNGGNALGLAPYVTAVLTSTTVITLTCAYPGTIGNLVTVAKVAANLTLGGATLTSGAVAASSTAPVSISCGR